MTRYPSLLELRKYYPYGEPAICDHAGIEPELLHAVLEDGETLLPEEIGGERGFMESPVGSWNAGRLPCWIWAGDVIPR